MKNKIKRFFDRYVKGDYHCDKCPYCWGGGYNAGSDDYDDCGCFIKGDIRDTCRLLPPFRFLLGYFRKKKAEYCFNHEYDDCGEFFANERGNTMNREILFRGFYPCEDGSATIYVEGEAARGRWVEGGYAEIAPPPVCFSSDPQEPIKTCIVAEQGFADWGMPRHYSMYEVLHSTVGQYTGKDDKNGVKIFKGDIILANFQTPFVVEWDNEGCRFLGVQPNDNSRHFTASDKYICYLSDTREVIGTIFDKED